jgi:hypothetical protein
MTHLGKKVNEKRFGQVADYLIQGLENGEEILALFNANRQKPQITGLTLTSRRMITVKGIGRNIRFVNEVAADEIQEFASEKGLGKIIKLFITKKDGTKEYVCMMTHEDILIANSLLSKMSGSPRPINKEILARNTSNKTRPIGTVIFLFIIGGALLFVFPPMALPFLIGGLVSLSLRRK